MLFRTAAGDGRISYRPPWGGGSVSRSVPVARPAGKSVELQATVAVFGTVVVAVVGTEGDTTVSPGDLERSGDVFPTFGGYLVGVNPRG